MKQNIRFLENRKERILIEKIRKNEIEVDELQKETLQKRLAALKRNENSSAGDVR